MGNNRDSRQADFDGQAERFDTRAGLGDSVASAVAHALLTLADLGDRNWLLELGAGTGEIGRHLSESRRYVAIDSSPRMLQSPNWSKRDRRVVANGDARWPVADRRIACVFASRSAHLMETEHIARELRRIADTSMYFVLGRTHRDKNGYKELLRTRMQEAARERGIEPRDGRSHVDRLLESLSNSDRAGEATSNLKISLISPTVATSWVSRGRPIDAIDSWRSKSGLAGVTVSSNVRDDVLRDVQAWAEQRFGDLDAEQDSPESYVLTGVRFVRT